jgi:WD40 repeat protein
MVRRLRIALGGATVLLVLALVTGFVAVGQAHRANRSALSADAGRVGAQALVTSDITKSLLMAVAAARLTPSTQAQENLDAALAQRPQLVDSTSVPAGSPLSMLGMSPDGSTFAVADRSHHVWTYDSSNLDPIGDTQVGRSQPSNFDTPVAYDPTGHSLAVGAAPGRRGLVRLLDPHTLAPLPHQLSGWPDRWAEVVGFAYSADGRHFAVSVTYPNGKEGSANTTGREPVQTGGVLIWNLEKPDRAARVIPLHSALFGPVALSPHGSLLYFAGTSSSYDLESGRWLHGRGEPVPTYGTTLAIDPTGRLVAGTFGNFASPEVSLLNARNGAVVGRLKGYSGDITQVSFSRNGRELAATTDSGSALVWDVATGDLIQSVDDGSQLANGLGWSADGNTLFTTADDSSEIHAWDLSGFRTFVPEVPIRHGRGMTGSALWSSPDGNAIAVGYNIGPPTQLWTINVAQGAASSMKVTRSDQSIDSTGSFSPDGRLFAAGYDRGWVQVFRQDRARPVMQRRVETGALAQVAYTPDARGIAVLDDEGNVRLVDATTLRPRGPRIHLAGTRTWDLAMGPDSRQAFVFGGPPEYRVGPAYPGPERWWLVDLVSGRILQQGKVGIEAWFAAFSPRGDRVALVGDHGEVELLDPTTGRPVGPPAAGNGGTDVYVAFNDDGSRFAVVSDVSTVSLWDGRDGRLLDTNPLPSQGNAVIAFRPDGTLTVGTPGGGVYHWNPSLAHAIAFACQAAGRDMTRAEWSQVLPDQPYRSVCPAAS